MVRAILFILIALLGVGQLKASHLMGGEITWTCQPNGQFKFFLKLYRDCNSTVSINQPVIQVHNHPSVSTINITLVSQTDISPQCNGSGPTVTCAGASGTTPGAVEEFIYESAPVTLAGVPPPEGWVFTFDDCCRNAAITNLLNPGNEGFTIRAKMFSYNGQDMNPCFDSSPQFAEKPATVICTGYPFTYNHNAFDSELDSLTYSWADPLDDFTGAFASGTNPSAIPFSSGYSVNSPLPSQTQNSNNIPATIDANTGEISYTSFTQGNFVTVVKVEAWKCGTKVAEIYRELQVVLIGGCGANSPPDVTPPFQNPNNGLFELYSDTVTAGDLVTFSLSGTDFDMLPNGNPQTMTIFASGSQFGTGYSNTTNGCLNPPCATLTPPPPISGQFGVSTDFSWQTNCSHISITDACASTSNTYNFIIRVADDFCPAPAINVATISIVVEALPTVGPPSLRCINVLANGQTELTWEEAVDTVSTFDSYHIYHSTSPSGPYTVIDSVFNINTTSYTHAGASTTGPNYYFVRTRSGCGGQVSTTPSDTLSSIFLTVDNPGQGVAELSWNALANPLPPTSSGWYRIYREYPAGTWVLLDSTQGLTYSDEIIYCNTDINYQIEITDDLGCSSFSNIDGDNFSDISPPPAPPIDTVSVDPATGFASISWEGGLAPDIREYVIYRESNPGSGIWNAVDTVPAPGTYYLNTLTSIASQEYERYRVAAIDSCDNISLQGSIHNTIYLDVYLDECSGETTLRWNDYVNWDDGVGSYGIYASLDSGSTYSQIASVDASDSVFVHDDLTQYLDYCYFVRAVDGSGTKTSSSNVQCVYTDIPKPPDFTYINLVTVPNTGGVEVYCYVDTSADVLRYDIYRSEDSLNYTWLDSISFSSDTVIFYYDSLAKSSQKPYYYQVVTVDSCGANADTSEFSKTIYLEAEGKADRTNELVWNEYQQWLGGVESYNIYRSIGGVFDPTPIANVPPETGIYIDDVAEIVEGDGEFCYYIEALEGSGNSFGFMEISHSNEACALQLPNFFVPNAFVPEGLNSSFKPVTVFVEPDNYYFAVFNRWGEVIFETTDLAEAWDGTFEGEIVQQGAYVYYFEYQSASGNQYEKRGTVTVLR